MFVFTNRMFPKQVKKEKTKTIILFTANWSIQSLRVQ